MSVQDLAQLLAALGAGSALPAILRHIKRLSAESSDREMSREEHIALLRKALDKAGIRFNAAVFVADLLLVALELVEELPPAAERAKKQARMKLADVVRTLEMISGAADADE
jgi:hypothetical protein